MRSSPWIGKMLPISSGSRRTMGSSPPSMPRRLSMALAPEPIDAPVLQALQLVLELERRQLQARIELERCRIHLRGQGPAAALELMRDQPIEIQDVGAAQQRRGAHDREQRPPDVLARMRGVSAHAVSAPIPIGPASRGSGASEEQLHGRLTEVVV